MRTLTYNWEFNVLNIENYRQKSKLTPYFNFIIENHATLPGDIVELGVYKGRSLLATAMLLKELGSNKRVWGFDTFGGFPSYHPNDDLQQFEKLYQNGSISEAFYEQVQLNQAYRQFLTAQPVQPSNISSSGDFSDSSLEALQQKIDYMQLDNIELVVGSFAETLTDNFRTDYPPIMAALVDCDLYDGYRVGLPFIWEHLTRGGYIYLDEYYSLKFPGARIATDEFFRDKQDQPQKHVTEPNEFERWYVHKIWES